MIRLVKYIFRMAGLQGRVTRLSADLAAKNYADWVEPMEKAA